MKGLEVFPLSGTLHSSDEQIVAGANSGILLLGPGQNLTILSSLFLFIPIFMLN